LEISGRAKRIGRITRIVNASWHCRNSPRVFGKALRRGVMRRIRGISCLPTSGSSRRRETVETRALLSVVLVDADKNIVRGLRAVMFSPDFTFALHMAIGEQAVCFWNQVNYDAQLSRAYQRWPTTEQMLSWAIARTKGGA